jgi:hypothetical protein
MPLRRALEARKLPRGYAILHLRERRVGVDTLRHKACPPVLHLSVKNGCLNWLALHTKISDPKRRLQRNYCCCVH